MVQNIFQVFILLMKFLLLRFNKFSRSSEVLFSCILLHLRLFDGIFFQYSQVHGSFLFSECSDSFLIWQFYPIHYLFFPLFIMSMARFSMPNSVTVSWLYILIVCISLKNLFHFFQTTDVVHVYQEIGLVFFL